MIRDPECPEPEPDCDSEVRRAVAAVRALRNVADLDERAKVLAELRLAEGRRLRCR